MKYKLIKSIKKKFINNKNFTPFTKNKKFTIIKTHKNNITVLYFKKEKFFRKLSKNKSGVEKIKSELNGQNWYLKEIKKKNKKIILDYKIKNKFAYIDLKEIVGVKAKSWRSFEENYRYLEKILKFYIAFFPKQNAHYIHGDFTLDNIIFQKRDFYIIDWEMFGAKKSLRGYDIAYLILSAICLPYISNKTFSEKDKKLFIKLWTILLEKKFNKKLLLNPFIFFKKKIKTDPVLSKSYRLSKTKFFPFITDNEFQKKILKLVNSLKYGK